MVKHFYDNLQDTLNNISSTDFLLVLGDLNARVGLRNRDSAVWSNVLSHFGIDDINQAGEYLLSFCDLNQLSLVNTEESQPFWYLDPSSNQPVQYD